MAHTKTGASVKGSRNPVAKRLGIKKYEGQTVKAGNILIRQRGTKIHAGEGVYLSKDYTIIANIQGKVYFNKKQKDVYINVT